MIQVSSRGHLYAPTKNAFSMWRKTTNTISVAPQWCMPRINHPNVTSFMMYSMDS